MRKALALGTTGAALAGMAVLAAPASADACTAGQIASLTCTTVALTVVDGTLSIAVQPSALGTTTPVNAAGATTDISLGATTVTDTRVTSTGWAAKATSTALTPAVGSPGDAIGTANHSFFVSTVLTEPTIGTLTYRNGTSSATEGPVASGTNYVSVSSSGASVLTSFIPTMRVAVPQGQPGGVYTGTVVQSVS